MRQSVCLLCVCVCVCVCVYGCVFMVCVCVCVYVMCVCVCVCVVCVRVCVCVCILCKILSTGNTIIHTVISSAPEVRGGLGEKSGPGVTVRPAHSIHGALPTQCIARIDQSVAYLEKYPYTQTLFWMMTKKLHYIWYLPGWTHGIKLYWLL